jgi:hypothetical protein
MSIVVLQKSDSPDAPVLHVVPWPGQQGSLWHRDSSLLGRVPLRLMFWHAEVDRLGDLPRAGSCPLFHARLIAAIWGEDLGACERIPAVIADAPEPSRQRTDYAAVHVLPVLPRAVVDETRSDVDEFLPGSPVWSAIRTLRLNEALLPAIPAFRIAPFRSAVFLQGAAVARVREGRFDGVRLVPLEEFQADG